MMMKASVSLMLLLCGILCPLSGTGCYSEYWQRLYWKMWQQDPFTFQTYLKIETGDHIKNFRSIQLSEQFIYQVSDNFSCEAHYTYIHGRSVVDHSPWKWQHRLELEGNRLFNLPWSLRIKTRNRLEIRREKDDPKTEYRLRQLSMLIIPIEGCGALKSFSIYNEAFYNVTKHLFDQDRICPFQLNFALSEKKEGSIFFMLRLFTSNKAWNKSAVFGTQLRF